MTEHNAQDLPEDVEAAAEEVAAEAQVDWNSLPAEDREYLREHALKKPMGVTQIWAMGVGAVIAGAYFGWNGGLGEAGPIGMLLATLFVCALYMTWVLALSELSVAMPFAGGPLAYGRRAVGPGFGFLMGWSMFLESLFATIGTAIAVGGYITFLLEQLFDGLPKAEITTVSGLVVVGLFGLLQCSGARLQAKVMEAMTHAAILGLIWFWVACLPSVKIERIWTSPLLPSGWTGVLKAIPFAIWWLVIIESVALAAEEAHEPHRSIPKGLTLAQITLIGLVLLTWFVASGAGLDYRVTGSANNLFPLPWVYREAWPGPEHRIHLLGFCVVALSGLVASLNGMLYAVSRQSFSLGRAGYLPRFLGSVHPSRRTPSASIIAWCLVIAGFVVWGYFNEKAVQTAVLTCNLTALLWYALAMICLFILRKKEPDMPRPFKVPLYPWLPIAVLAMSVFAALVYGILQEPVVLWLTLIMYGVGMSYYFAFARGRLASAAPEELAARAAESREVS